MQSSFRRLPSRSVPLKSARCASRLSQDVLGLFLRATASSGRLSNHVPLRMPRHIPRSTRNAEKRGRLQRIRESIVEACDALRRASISTSLCAIESSTQHLRICARRAPPHLARDPHSVREVAKLPLSRCAVSDSRRLHRSMISAQGIDRRASMCATKTQNVAATVEHRAAKAGADLCASPSPPRDVDACEIRARTRHLSVVAGNTDGGRRRAERDGFAQPGHLL